MSDLRKLAQTTYEARKKDYTLAWESFFLNVKQSVPNDVYEFINKENCNSYDVIRQPSEEFFYVKTDDLPTIIVRAAIIEQMSRSTIDYINGGDKYKNTSTTMQVLFCVDTDRDWSTDFEWILAKAYRTSLEQAAKAEAPAEKFTNGFGSSGRKKKK